MVFCFFFHPLLFLFIAALGRADVFVFGQKKLGFSFCASFFWVSLVMGRTKAMHAPTVWVWTRSLDDWLEIFALSDWEDSLVCVLFAIAIFYVWDVKKSARSSPLAGNVSRPLRLPLR